MQPAMKRVMSIILLLSTGFSVLSVLAFGAYILLRLFTATSHELLQQLLTIGFYIAAIAQGLQFLAVAAVLVTWMVTKTLPKTRREMVVLVLSLIPFVPVLILLVVIFMYFRARILNLSPETRREIVEMQQGGAIDVAQQFSNTYAQNLGAVTRQPPPAPMPIAPPTHAQQAIKAVIGPVTADSLSRAPVALLSTAVVVAVVSLSAGITVGSNVVTFPPPQVSGYYVGTAFNITHQQTSKLTINLQQHTTSLAGYLTYATFFGTGVFEGSIDSTGNVSFHSNDANQLEYIGVIQATGELTGTYALHDQSQKGTFTLQRSPTCAPQVSTVSPVLTVPDQTITIQGTCFGTHAPVNKNDTQYFGIKMRYQTTTNSSVWNACYTNDNPADSVTCTVTSWTDTTIVFSGFSGAYGGGWSVNKGDLMLFEVWNPQSNQGAGVCLVTAGSGASTQCV